MADYCVLNVKCLDHQEIVATSYESQPGVQSGRDSSTSGEYNNIINRLSVTNVYS